MADIFYDKRKLYQAADKQPDIYGTNAKNSIHFIYILWYKKNVIPAFIITLNYCDLFTFEQNVHWYLSFFVRVLFSLVISMVSSNAESKNIIRQMFLYELNSKNLKEMWTNIITHHCLLLWFPWKY